MIKTGAPLPKAQAPPAGAGAAGAKARGASPAKAAAGAKSDAKKDRLPSAPLMKAAHSIMHAIDGDVAWPAPMMVVKCDAKARPGYQTGAAHEYMDQPDVLKAKVRALARGAR